MNWLPPFFNVFLFLNSVPRSLFTGNKNVALTGWCVAQIRWSNLRDSVIANHQDWMISLKNSEATQLLSTVWIYENKYCLFKIVIIIHNTTLLSDWEALLLLTSGIWVSFKKLCEIWDSFWCWENYWVLLKKTIMHDLEENNPNGWKQCCFCKQVLK